MMLGIDPDHSMGSRSCKGKKMKKDFGTKVPMGESSGTDHSAKMGLRQLQSLVQVCTYQLFIDLFPFRHLQHPLGNVDPGQLGGPPFLPQRNTDQTGPATDVQHRTLVRTHSTDKIFGNQLWIIIALRCDKPRTVAFLNPASSDGSRHRIQPGNGTLYWTSAETRYFLEISVHANPGEPGKYALLLPPPGKGAQGKTRIYKLFLSGGYYAFVNPDE